ncbi:ankyrin repeat domain-containing protein [Wolbachia endosymbiont (group B) of Athalia cordata]|uniref:ankyrin repeat domain-containing protein n=1 Tax=Wolbachia endosymbiont (group B) of Athalia cordata TaxID=2953986 RepID=UPI00223145D8|nr:ankyrin repeat domain-containing protein [Wolbachia endosymbiont (group B) of Athalia cordata]
MTLDDFLKMLEEINDTSGLSKNNIVERIKIKLERIDLRSWKDSGFNINHIFTTHSDLDPVETTLLHFAAKSGYENVVRALIACEADVNARDCDRCTPLHFAAEWNHKSILEILIESEANVNACDNDGYTPLHFADEGGNENIVRTLIEHGAYVDAQNNNGQTPLHLVTDLGCKDVISSLSGNASPRAEMAVGRVEQITLAGRLELF